MPRKTLIRIVALSLVCAPALHGGDDDKIDLSPFVVTGTYQGLPLVDLNEFCKTHTKTFYLPGDSVSDFEQYTFSNTLLALNEPVLTAEGKSKDYYALRILYVPSLAGLPVAVRIEKNGDQITRRAVRLSKRNSSSIYDTLSGHKTDAAQETQEQKNESISAETLEKIQNELNNAGFDTLPLHDDVRGLDGNEFLIERIENGKHTVFTRWTPEANTAKRQLTKVFALADRLFQEAGFWEKNDLPEQIPLLENLIVRKIDFVVPEGRDAGEDALSERFFNKPEERAFDAVTSKNWRGKWFLFTDTLITKAEDQKLDAASLRRCLKALNYGRNKQTMFSRVPFPSLLDIPSDPTTEEDEKQEAEYQKAKALEEIDKEKNPELYYDESLAIIPVGAYLARHTKGDCWIIVCKWELLPEQNAEAKALGHIMVWAMDARTAKVVAYVTCD